MSSLKPLNDRILVKCLNAELSEGGIIIPSSATRKIARGEVVAVNEGGWTTEQGAELCTSLRVGQIVHFDDRSGAEIEHRGEKFRTLRESELMCVEVADG